MSKIEPSRGTIRHDATSGKSKGKRARRPKRGEQLAMGVIVDATAKPYGWGGARKGAGAKKRGTKGVAHRARPALDHRHPVHVTLRARQGLPSFRTQRIYRMLFDVLTRQMKRKYAADFQVVEFSIQSNHLHVVAEATSKQALRSGTSGLVIAFALQLNKLLRRTTGKVWAERYHARALSTPREVKNALAYVFHNWKKHGMTVRGAVVDHLSSAPSFRGWLNPGEIVSLQARDDLPPWEPRELRTWMLRTGWKIHGPLLPSGQPASRH